jgi:hypothetical protein
MSEFDDLVDVEGLGPDEEARLRRVHDLLVQAGPPIDLPPALGRAPDPEEAEIVPFPLLPRRRWVATGLIAAALVAIAFGGGYLLGHGKSSPSAFATKHVVPMHGSSALAVIRLGDRDQAGNWPMEFQVTGLARQTNRAAYYELWLTRGGKPVAPCGTFRVNAHTTTVHLSVPYESASFDGWVVTAQPPHDHGPGSVVLTT